MSKVIDGIKYTKDHEWIKKLDNGNYQVGITDYAQGSLGDIVYVDVPDAGAALKQGESIGTIESVKAVSDIYSPVTGAVVSKNTEVSDNPAVVNSDPYSAGWLIEVSLSNASELDSLLSASDYEKLLSSH
jgi:glycine cleavage system H protein